MLLDHIHTDDPLHLRRLFENFAIHGTIGSSPLYTQLTQGVAADPDLLNLAAQATRHPLPNILFGAVHYLLLRGEPHPLAAYFPSIAGDAARQDDPIPAFKDFCRAHRDELIHLMQTRRVQTNEVNRCALTLPAFGMVAEHEPGCPLALLEIGASAGLNLLWDYYGYAYSDGRRYGPADAPLRLSTELRGDSKPPIPATLPPVSSRLGLDLNPVDVLDEDAALWLRALVWPEHDERAARLQQAIAILRQHPPELLAGDALELLPMVIEHVPQDAALCVYHTFVVNQFTAADRDRLTALLADLSAERAIYRISIEWLHGDQPLLEWRVYRDGSAVEQTPLAYADGHGRWLQWL